MIMIMTIEIISPLIYLPLPAFVACTNASGAVQMPETKLMI